MKTIRESIFNDNDILKNSNDNIISNIENWIYDNFICSGIKIIIHDNKFIVNSYSVECKNHNLIYLTNNLFEWGDIMGYFNISHCKKLKSLENGPKNVKKYYNIDGCSSLKNLKGAPEKIGEWMSGNYCDSLLSLKNFPIVKGTASFKDCPKLKVSDREFNEYNRKKCKMLIL